MNQLKTKTRSLMTKLSTGIVMMSGAVFNIRADEGDSGSTVPQLYNEQALNDLKNPVMDLGFTIAAWAAGIVALVAIVVVIFRHFNVKEDEPLSTLIIKVFCIFLVALMLVYLRNILAVFNLV